MSVRELGSHEYPHHWGRWVVEAEHNPLYTTQGVRYNFAAQWLAEAWERAYNRKDWDVVEAIQQANMHALAGRNLYPLAVSAKRRMRTATTYAELMDARADLLHVINQLLDVELALDERHGTSAARRNFEVRRIEMDALSLRPDLPGFVDRCELHA